MLTGILLLALHAGFAQSQALDPALLQSLTPEQREQVLKNLSGASGPEEAAAAPEAARDVPQPLPPPAPPAGPDTPAEQLKPFGYDLFQGEAASFTPVTEIPVPHDYVLGPGDILKVQMFGNEVGTHTLTVSRDGAINFPKLGPIEAAGLRFDAFRELIEKRVANEMIGVKVNVSLGRLRSIRVFVVGDAARPGSYTISSLSTMTNALVLSGGVSPVGSLRDIQLKRKGRLVARLDLYDLLLRGDSSRDARLMPGDVLFIPPVGKRVTIAGHVKRPAIYEIRGETTVEKVVELAGGLLPSAALGAVQIERFEDAGKKLQQLDLTSPDVAQMEVRDGDILRLRPLYAQVEQRVELLGHLKYPGSYPWTPGLKLSQLLGAAQVLPSGLDAELYSPLALLERTTALTGLREWRTLNLPDILSGKADEALQAGDLLVVFTRSDIEFLSSPQVRRLLLGTFQAKTKRDALAAGAAGRQTLADPASCAGLQALGATLGSQQADRFAALAAALRNTQEGAIETTECPVVFQRAAGALPFLLEHATAVLGEVRRPGFYPLAQELSLREAIQLAGGLTPDSDLDNIEYLSYAVDPQSIANQPRYMRLRLAETGDSDRSLAPGDIVTVRPRFLDQEIGVVEVRGEVRFPGRYNIIKGETLSQLLQRAGGFTENAYPYGAVFTRVSAREAETASFRRAAAELENTLITAVTSGSFAKESGTAPIQMLGELIGRLRTETPIGRVVIEADPEVLARHPEKNTRLEPGDALFIPKKPATVTVAGQVLNPSNIPHDSGNDARDYVKRAGGLADAADDDRVFVVLPNGTAQHVSLSFWGGGAEIPPGSTIVVPRDATPINPLVLTERVLGIFRDLAISAAAIVTITSR